MEIDLQALSTEELSELTANIAAEQARRNTLAQAEARVIEIENRREEEIAAVVSSYLTARDGTEDSSWKRPTGAHDAYPKDWTVVVDGVTWISTVPNNVWEPGQSGWRQVNADGSPAPWVQPTGAHDAYNEQEVVTHNGRTWESKVPANVWEPPEQWLDITPVEETPDPEPEQPSYPTWVQPTGGHDAYKIGDRVMFAGAAYESVINGNTWSPTAYPAGWKAL